MDKPKAREESARSGDDPLALVRYNALARSLAGRLLFCNLDELRVLDVLLGRLELGRERYGHLDLKAARDWDREEAEELLDARIYRAIGKLQETDKQVAIIEAAAKRGQARK